MTERFPDWKTLYEQAEARTLPWSYEGLDPDLEEALEALDLREGTFLDLGTGGGTQAAALARRGFQVTGTDVSEAAIEQAAKHSPEVRFLVDDILDSRLEPGFDCIFDRGCLHVLAPETRPGYVDTVSRLLKPGGSLFLKTFSTEEPDYSVGPYRFSPGDLRSLFEPRFRILSTRETIYQGTLERPPRALFAVLQRGSGEAEPAP